MGIFNPCEIEDAPDPFNDGYVIEEDAPNPYEDEWIVDDAPSIDDEWIIEDADDPFA
jgi:hypothetical protein